MTDNQINFTRTVNKHTEIADNGAFFCCSSGAESVFNLYYWYTQEISNSADVYCIYFFHSDTNSIKNTIPEYLSFKRLMKTFSKANYDIIFMNTKYISRWMQFYLFFAAQYAVNSLNSRLVYCKEDRTVQAMDYYKTWIITGQTLEEKNRIDHIDEKSDKIIESSIKQISNNETEIWNISSDYYKHEALAMLPKDLRQCIWTCHKPIDKGDHYKGCEECVKCTELQDAYKKADLSHVPQYIEKTQDSYTKAAMLLSE